MTLDRQPDQEEPRRARAVRLRPLVARWVEVLGAGAIAARTGQSAQSVRLFVRGGATPLSGALDAYEEMLAADTPEDSAFFGWRPTEANIAALPPPVRSYIRALEGLRSDRRPEAVEEQLADADAGKVAELLAEVLLLPFAWGNGYERHSVVAVRMARAATPVILSGVEAVRAAGALGAAREKAIAAFVLALFSAILDRERQMIPADDKAGARLNARRSSWPQAEQP